MKVDGPQNRFTGLRIRSADDELPDIEYYFLPFLVNHNTLSLRQFDLLLQ